MACRRETAGRIHTEQRLRIAQQASHEGKNAYTLSGIVKNRTVIQVQEGDRSSRRLAIPSLAFLSGIYPSVGFGSTKVA
jgi:hypothetical protein